MAGILSSTQKHLDVVDIKNDIIILKGGKFRMVMEAQAINFDLLSEAEQDAAIYSYANLINSLDFPIQVVIRTRQVDITNYIEYLEGFRKLQPTTILRQQLESYIDFVKELVTENTVLFKKFYVVIPHMTKVTEQSKSVLDPIMELLGKEAPEDSSNISDETLEDARKAFAQRTQELVWQFRRLGIGVRILSTEELIRLFYEIYNPETSQNEGLHADLMGYTTTIIKPNVA